MAAAEVRLSAAYVIMYANMADSARCPSTLDEALYLLEAADFFVMEAMRESALDYILRSADSTPAFRLSVACHYRVDEWLKDEVKTLLMGTCMLLTVDDVRILPAPILHYLLQIYRRLDMHRARIEVLPPDSVHPDKGCIGAQNDACRRAWATYWIKVIGPRVLDTAEPWTGNDVINHFGGVETIDGMSSRQCQGASITRLKDLRGERLRKDYALINKAESE